ncbi:MAG: cyclic pyranopterin monophosphate synthase MoaC [Candidatus Omnitrophica bacterium]|nr:cyclic pyranopterin monophosphate synthase MoaC [Candidatus Omnitrophota bacterium]MBU1923599.1 cyclic pyranopterin monophosphate synthase MoaC [Candidatus Omnitrophota bacterium]
MVDIGKKPATLREAVVQASIYLRPQTIKLIANKKVAKGDVLTIAKCAGILAAKKVDELIPLCHPLLLEHVEIDFKLERKSILITARCKTKAKTGVEMEAMVASCMSALTIYDMCKSIDRSAMINQIRLIEKTGGRSGHYKRK